MFDIEKINISKYGAATVTLSTDFGGNEITVKLSPDQAYEVEKIVREMLATAMRMPIIKEKMEDLKAIHSRIAAVESVSPPPAVVETSNGPAAFTPDGYKPDIPEVGDNEYCTTHRRFHSSKGCPNCAADENKDDHGVAF